MTAERASVALARDEKFTYCLFPPMDDDPVQQPGWRPTNDLIRADAVLLTSRTNQRAQTELLDKVTLRLKPIVSLFGDGPRWIDGIVHPHQRDGLAGLLVEKLPGIIRRISDLPSGMRETRKPREVLLGRLYTRAIDLTACYNPNETDGVSYPAVEWMKGITGLAEGLTERGLLSRRFFDRLHTCPECHGSRLNVREECIPCRSASLKQEATIHHFKCGHIARESAFRDLGKFNCPKCRVDLRHAGLDYRKPGSVLVCLECGAMNDAAAVGFACMDCGKHSDGERVETRDWYHYSLTGVGVDALLHGRVDDDERFTAPASLRFALQHAMARAEDMGENYVVLRITCANAEAIAESSPLQWLNTKNLLRDCLSSSLRRVDTISECSDAFLCVLPTTTPALVKQLRSNLMTEVARLLKHDPGLVISEVDRIEQRHMLRAGV